ncbi:MAG: ATP-dependent helicase [Planctomycetes bacterium]|nr:ATP-dependent helicase [Planctomycetota bacterium]
MAGGGPLLVIAGAGSGKTRTLTYRVARLLESGVPADSILLVTFTNKAAREMLRRVESLLDATGPRIWGGTFHHIGHSVLRRHAADLGYSTGFSILDREDSRDLMAEVVSENKTSAAGPAAGPATAAVGAADDAAVGAHDDTRAHGPAATRLPKADVLVDIGSFAANTLRTLDDVVAERYPYHLERLPEIHKAVAAYEARKRALQVMDFDDLLVLWHRLLREPGEASELFARRFEHILVDEYQDTNRLQGEIVDLLARGHRNLTVVGDDAQSIYAFRGAHFENILSFPTRYANARTVRLEVNYRSTPQVLALANSSIAHNHRQFPKTLQPMRPDGERPALVATEDGRQQARFVAQRAAEHVAEGIPPREIAVLYRAHYHALELQMELTRAKIPFTIRSGLKFFEQAHVKDLVAYARIVANPRDAMAWRRVIALYPGMGKVTVSRIVRELEAAADPLALALLEPPRIRIPKKCEDSWKQLARTLRDLSEPGPAGAPGSLLELALFAGYEDYARDTWPNADARLQDLRQLVDFAGGYGSLPAFLADVALQADAPGDEAPGRAPEDSAILLTTIHQAKGLEWQVVFLIGLAEGSFPDARSFASADALEEERRLFYVAVTRAKDHLYLCYPLVGGRTDWAAVQQPSAFLQELEPATYEEWRLTR